MKNVLKRDSKKRDKKITAQAHISLLSQIKQWLKSGKEVDVGGTVLFIYLKLK